MSLGAGGTRTSRSRTGRRRSQAFSDAQAVALSYNDDGQLVDRGTTEGADAIMALLRDEWKWPVEQSELNPNDPITNTATEYMYQMATIAHHTLDGTQTVVLTEPVQYDADGDGVRGRGCAGLHRRRMGPGHRKVDAVFQPGTYLVPVAGRYYSQLDRTHPLEGKVRDQAWSGLVHGLFAELGVGATTASTLQLGLGVAGGAAAVGLAFIILGGGLIWAGMAKEPEKAAMA